MKKIPSKSGKYIAAIGTFDGVHLGHNSLMWGMNVLSAFKGYYPMFVTFDRHPLDVIAPDRAPRLLMPHSERTSALRGMLSRVAVLKFDDELRRLTAREFMQLLRDRYNVEAIYMGFNHHFGSDRLKDIADYRREAESLGMKIFEGKEARTDSDRPISSTEIRRLIVEGDVATASAMLGRPYRIIGIVEHGEQLGRTIGFPTANLRPIEERQLVPGRGVYACRAIHPNGKQYKAVANIGVRPTVSASGKQSVEVYLLDFTGDLYGRPLTIDFISRIRDEHRFDNVEALRRQLQADVDTARLLLK